MKRIATIASFLLIAAFAKATTHVVTCQNTPSHFLPVTINIKIGDTIHWVWVAGTHVVGPIKASDIPAGAAMWNAPIDASNHSFEYVVTVAGNYHYVCHPAFPHGEDAYMVASSVTGVPQNNEVNNRSFAYPNPFSDKITIEISNADLILVYNLIGERIKSFPLNIGQTTLEADLATLPKGIFFYTVFRNGALLERRKIIKG